VRDAIWVPLSTLLTLAADAGKAGRASCCIDAINGVATDLAYRSGERHVRPPGATAQRPIEETRMKQKYWLLASLMLLPGSALAGVTQLPEPGILELLATAGVVAAVIALRKRRK